MNLPNKLTLGRLACVPFFMVFMIFDDFWARVLALVIFVGASITDLYDGKIARRTGEVTVIGAFLDPLVDKMLIAAALIGFVELRVLHIPAWMVILIVSREFLITGLRILAASRNIVMAAEKAGKWKTGFQMTAIITTLVTLISYAAAQRWPTLRLEGHSPWQEIVWGFLQHAPYWMTLWVTGFTVVSGYMYIRKYSDLLRSEFSVTGRRSG